jgi:thioredoxin 1
MKGNFQQLIDAETPVLVDFFAEWCGPCKMQAPILTELAPLLKDKVRIIKIDVDKNQAVAMRYGIQSVPTIVLFKKGQQVWRQSGVAQKTQLLSVINQYT